MKQWFISHINNIRLALVALIFINALLLWNNNINLRNGLRVSSKSSKAVLDFQQNNNRLHNLSLQHIENPMAAHRIEYNNLKTNKFKKEIDQIPLLPAEQKDLLLKSYGKSRIIMTLQVKATVSYTHLRAHETLRYLVCSLQLE